ncbi:MAG: Lsm family RNA-binding protein [Promethearchaeota archaeon]
MSIKLNINASFNKEINQLFGQIVKVQLVSPDKYFIGTLSGYNIATGSIVLKHAKDEQDKRYSKIVLRGSYWDAIYLEKPPFPMKDLSKHISKYFPTGQVKYEEESNTISILNGKIIVSENGITRGSGPTAERVYNIYKEFMEDLKKKK